MLTALACGEGAAFLPVTVEELPRLLAGPGRVLWVDLEAPTEAEAALLPDLFHFHQLTIDDCFNTRVDPPKIDDYGDYLFLIVQGLDFSASNETVATSELDLYLGPSYIVTFHHQPVTAITEVRARCQRAAPLPARGPDWLAHAILDTLVDHLLPVVEAMDEEIAALEDQALANPQPALIERMTGLKRATLRLRRLVAPQRDVINRLSRGDFAHLVGEDTRMYYRDIYDHLVRLGELVEGLRDLGDSVIATYLATTNNRMNEIMKALSLVGTVFLPLTLVASIFGTNFAPTYEDWGWPGFLAMVVFMLLTAALLVWLFQRRRWL